jgi:hypothetical protein
MAVAQMIKHGAGTVHIRQAQEHGGEARKHCSTGFDGLCGDGEQ